MNDMERRKFEDSFQDAFKDAEVGPSENVWTNIELDLVKAEGDKMKSRLLFFKMLAAASVVFAMCVAGVGYYVFNNKSAGEIAQVSDRTPMKNELSESSASNEIGPKVNEQGEASDAASANDPVSTNAMGDKQSDPDAGKALEDVNQLKKDESVEGVASQKTTRASDRFANPGAKERERLASEQNNKPSAKAPTAQRNNAQSRTETIMESTVGVNTAKVNNSKSVSDITTSTGMTALAKEQRQRTGYLTHADPGTNSLPSFYQPKQPKLELQKAEVVADPGMLLLAQLADEEKKYAKEERVRKTNKSENLWTAVGFAAGSFTANNPTVTQPAVNSYYAMTSSTRTTATKQSKASGSAYSIGVSLGAKLSERWVLQGGFNYLTQTSDYTANGVVVKDNNYAEPQAESLNAFFDKSTAGRAQTTVAQTYPYNVNNSVRFVSLPVQAGYLIVNKKFGLQLNAGVSTDLFLQNTITPEGGGLIKTTQGRGDDSPYRSLNFSGLMGTEFSYRLGNRYRVAVNPGLRYPFSSVYKSNTGVDANPLTFDVGLRFRYIFH